jgi:fructose 1,6-bisphosphatase
MKITLSVIKADIGSIGGHIAPSHRLLETVRDRVADKSLEMRRQGFFGAAMLSMGELEYTGIVEKLKALDGRFTVRGKKTRTAPVRKTAARARATT